MRIFGRQYDHKQGQQPRRRAPDAYELYEREHTVHTPVTDPMEEDQQSEKVRRKPQRCNKTDYKAEEFIALKKLELSKDDQEYSYNNRSITNTMSHPHRYSWKVSGEATDFRTQYQSSLYDTSLNGRNEYYPEHVRNRHGFRASTRAVCHKIMRCI